MRIAAAVLTVFLTLVGPAVSVAVERGTFGPFVRSLNDAAHGYTVIDDPTGSAPTPQVERFEVRAGDCSANRGWNDCTSDRERSELSERGTRNLEGSTWWYGWSLYVPAATPNVYPTKLALGQFHQEGSHVVWMFQNGRGGYHLDDQVNGRTRRYHELIPQAGFRGRWHRIEVQAHWSTGDDGFFRVWVNGEQKVNYTGRTMTAERVYFKYGVYRSFLSRFRNATGAVVVPTQTVLFANVRRAESRQGLVPR